MVLNTAEDGRVVACGTGEFETIPADLVLVSIGYRSVPINGAGFDPAKGVVLNRWVPGSQSGNGMQQPMD